MLLKEDGKDLQRKIDTLRYEIEVAEKTIAGRRDTLRTYKAALHELQNSAMTPEKLVEMFKRMTMEDKGKFLDLLGLLV